MNLKNMNDEILIEQTQILVQEEREILTAILHHFKEIDRRRLYAAYGYKSLFDFGIRKFGYTEDQCYRRIQAMKLMKENPEVEEMLNSGELSLKHVNLAQTFFKKEQKADNEFSKAEKLDVLEKISNISFRDAERVILSMSSTPVAAKPDCIQNLTEDMIELKFTASNDLKNKIEQLKGLLAHKNPEISLGELVEKMADLCLTEWSPQKSAPVRKRRVIKISKAQIRRDIFKAAKNECENCGSHYSLEIDHIFPQAKGGSSDKDNLRVLCRSCNQRAAIETLGLRKMETYLTSQTLESPGWQASVLQI